MPAKQVKQESIARRFFEKLKSIWGWVHKYKWIGQQNDLLGPCYVLLLTPGPLSATDWIMRIVESHLTDKKCTIELEQIDTELGAVVKWKCLQEGQPVFQGCLMIQEEDFEKTARFYLDDPGDN
ncbi:hypothetical protein [uncultured Rikenella sp.]|uniref:hypothetical protein n=1 Tax=uncultured Rikenella sp. TaxID=368003 RepID=UPI00260000A4|nr:hypothetical protein [uncultured Rikenella sp.]